MKKQIRYGTWETNSSSTHTFSICPKEEFEEWLDGKRLYDRWGGGDLIKKGDVPEDADEEDYETYEHWEDDEYLETFVQSYTTKSGDKIVAFGKYGYDG